MATRNGKQINYWLDKTLIERIDAFWHERQFDNRATAIRVLLEHAIANPPPPPQPKQ